MNFDLTPQIPAIIDLAHIVLLALVLILSVLLLLRRGSQAESASTIRVDTPAHSPLAHQSIAQQPIEQKPVTAAAPPAPPVAPAINATAPDSALQLLAILQQEARLIDFIQEDLSGFSDADVGAAARVVHEGSKKAIQSHFKLAPIRQDEEGTAVILAQGFNSAEIRLTGNVVGSAPFKGTLIHRGWRVQEVKLPKVAGEHDARIVARAEVEL